MNHQNELRDRVKKFALRVIKLSTSLPSGKESYVIGKQVLRSGTSVGAQFREAFRAKSDADYISKVEGAIGELDETQYWFELLVEAEIVPLAKLQPLMMESDELIAILTTIIKKVKAKKK
jgi:four helix bundle protein